MRSSISVVLPAFNEEQNLSPTVNDAIDVLQQLGGKFEILIVDDGSTDGTAELCRDLVAQHDRVRVIRHERNRGYGAALRAGFDASRCDLVFFTDADGQFRFDQLADFLAGIASEVRRAASKSGACILISLAVWPVAQLARRTFALGFFE